jgi:hypothetical protein
MKMKINQFALIALMTVSLGYSQIKKDKDRNAIKSMCGCYEVTFNFSETFQHTKDSTYEASPDKISGGLEWAQLIKDEEDEIAIQHLLIVGPPNDKQIIKHWRQQWTYQEQDLYLFDGDNQWNYQELPYDEVVGQWTQKVYQVDDSPRYEGSATWVHVDGKSYWEDTTPAPLPRREFSIRDDYNVTLRTNRHEIKPFGWVHDQDNKKVIRKDDKEDVILAEEKGYNVYRKVADKRCKLAQDWWEEHKDFWSLVKSEWSRIYAKEKDIQLKKEVDGKPIFMHMFALQDEDHDRQKVRETIDMFLKQ